MGRNASLNPPTPAPRGMHGFPFGRGFWHALEQPGRRAFRSLPNKCDLKHCSMYSRCRGDVPALSPRTATEQHLAACEPCLACDLVAVELGPPLSELFASPPLRRRPGGGSIALCSFGRTACLGATASLPIQCGRGRSVDLSASGNSCGKRGACRSARLAYLPRFPGKRAGQWKKPAPFVVALSR